jgi:transposase
LWVGQRRGEATLRGGLRGLEALHRGFCAGITVVYSDMWKPYLKVVRTLLSAALNVLDPSTSPGTSMVRSTRSAAGNRAA